MSRPAWVRYSARFYERRWVVPILGAAIYPVFGSGSLHVVSVLAYAVFAGALFLLLRSRFSVLPSLAATVVVAALPPLRLWGHLPLTDTPALLLLVAGFAAARLALVRGSLWLLVWCLVVLAITFTRDTAIVVITAAAWLALRAPSRRAAAVAVTGAVAALPAAAFLGGSWRETLAYTFNDHRPPRDHSWHFVWEHYWPSLERLLRQEWAFLSANPEVGLVCGAGLLSLFLLRTRPDDRFLPMQRAGVIGGLAFLVLLPYFSRFRFELVFLPGVATGLAAGAERLSEIGRGRTAERKTRTVNR